MKTWLKHMLGLLLMVQLALLPLQGVSATVLFDSAGEQHEAYSMSDFSIGSMALAMECAQEHNMGMSGGHCSDHSCPSCQCVSCLLMPMPHAQVNLYNSIRSFSFLLHPLSPSLDGLYRPPRV